MSPGEFDARDKAGLPQSGNVGDVNEGYEYMDAGSTCKYTHTITIVNV